MEFTLCLGSVFEITCVEVEVECVRVFVRGGQNCLWLELCVTIQFRDHYGNSYTCTRHAAVECCDTPITCSCRPPRVEVCGAPAVVFCDDLIKITAPIRICL